MFHKLKISLFLFCIASFLLPFHLANAQPIVIMETSMGAIEIELDPKSAPKSVENFLGYVKKDFYNDTMFHRVIPGFMIQGGGFSSQLQKKDTRPPIPNEAKNGLKNTRGSIAMARTSSPHSATAQFYINHANNSFLDYPGQDGWGYTVFGKVVKGMKVVDMIASTKISKKGGPFQNMPETPILIKSVRIVSKK